MVFFEDRIYTVLNADELKAGDMVVVGDNLAELRDKVVEADDPTAMRGDFKMVLPIVQVKPIDAGYRFVVEDRYGTQVGYALAYLVERKVETGWRAYKDSDEMKEDFQKRYLTHISVDNPMWHPTIWLKHKEDNVSCQIIAVRDEDVYVYGCWNSFDNLLEEYTYLDGTLCGVEEVI